MKPQRWPLAREGFPFLLSSAVLTLVLWMLRWNLLGVLGILLTLFIAYFFRNPEETAWTSSRMPSSTEH